jgi:hypothetical protein
MSGKKGKNKGASADGDSGEASGGGNKGGTSVKVNKYKYCNFISIHFITQGSTYSL